MIRKQIGDKVSIYSYDAANQLVSRSENGKITNYRYDAAGRMVAEGSRSYQYGYLNKVMQVRDGGELIASMSYHSNGQLADVERPEGEKESFLWDGLALIKRNETSYINEPAATSGNPVLSGRSAMLNDTLGSTYAMEGEGGLIPIERTQFGTAETQQDEFFTGKPKIAELGYIFMYRNYRHELSKWQSSDLVGYADGLNKFAYVNNKVNIFCDLFGASGILTIHSSSTGSASSLNTSGHAWVSYTPDATGTTTTYGTWGNKPNGLGNGLHENLERGRPSDASRSTRISDEQEADLMQEIQKKKRQGEGAWTMTDPCSDDAIDMWEAGTGENLGTLGIYDTPSDLEETIKRVNGGYPHGFVHKTTE